MPLAVSDSSPRPSPRPGAVRPVRVGELVLGPRERHYVEAVLDSGRLSYGTMTRAFESRFAALHDCTDAVFCNSGTSALHLALEALKEQRGWRRGDEVIVPAVTFVATVNVVRLAGLTPVLVDVDPATYNIDPCRVAEAITPRTRCLVPVHLLGLPADMDPLLELAQRHNLAVVEDSCETMFARYRGRSVGSMGDVGCFSTYVAHLLVTGVGGLATTRDRQLAELMRSLMNHGRDRAYLSIDDDDDRTAPGFRDTVDRRFRFERAGFSYRCTELEAAIGLGQLDDHEAHLGARRANAAYYSRHLAELSGVLQLPAQPPDRDHSFMVYGLAVRPESGLPSMRPLLYFLEEHGIETRDMLPLIHQPVYRDWLGPDVGQRFPVAQSLHDRAFYLGCHPHLDEQDRCHVVATLRRYFSENRATANRRRTSRQSASRRADPARAKNATIRP